jgi:hypothetical protein
MENQTLHVGHVYQNVSRTERSVLTKQLTTEIHMQCIETSSLLGGNIMTKHRCEMCINYVVTIVVDSSQWHVHADELF